MEELNYDNKRFVEDVIFTDDTIIYGTEVEKTTNNIDDDGYITNKKIIFKHCTFKKILIITTKKKFDFSECNVDNTVLPDDISKINFIECTINLVNNNIKMFGGIIHHLHLENKIIKNKFYLNVPDIPNCRINITKLTMKNVEFEENVKLINCNFKNIICIENIDFNKRADFSGSNFNSIDNNSISFCGINFSDLTYFTQAKFLKNVIFEKVTLFDSVSFQEATFKADIEFKKITIKKDIDFTDIEIDSQLEVPINKRTSRLIKASLSKQNNITQANKFFRYEQESYLKQLKQAETKDVPTILVLWLNKYASGFGTDWIRPILVMFCFGFVASFFFLYWSNDPTHQLFIIKDMAIKDKMLYMVIGAVVSAFIYYFYHIKSWVTFGLLIVCYIFALIFIPNFSSLSNDMSKLINPMNIFKSKDYFEDIAPYGMFVKLTMATLIYQFIIAFRNNTRKK